MPRIGEDAAGGAGRSTEVMSSRRSRPGLAGWSGWSAAAAVVVVVAVALAAVARAENDMEEDSDNQRGYDSSSKILFYGQRGRRGGLNHLLRGKRSGELYKKAQFDHLMRGKKASSASNLLETDFERHAKDLGHLLRGKKSGSQGLDHFLRGRKAAAQALDHLLRGKKGGSGPPQDLDHLLRGRKNSDFHRILRSVRNMDDFQRILRGEAVKYLPRGRKEEDDAQEVTEDDGGEVDAALVDDDVEHFVY